MLKKVTPFLAFVLVLFPAIGLIAAGLTPEDVARLKQVESAELSPDGNAIAYSLRVPRKLFVEENGPAWVELHVWSGAQGSRPFVSGQVNVSQVQWAPDGQNISFLAKRGEDKTKCLYLISVEGGEARRILGHATDIESYQWSPEGKSLAFLAKADIEKNKEPLKKQGFDMEIYEENLALTEIWIVDLSGAEPQRRLLNTEGSVADIRWSPDGTRLAVSKAPSALVDDDLVNKRLFVVDSTNGQVLLKIDNPGKLDSVRWSPDGRRIGFLSAADPNDPNPGRLFIASAGDGQIEKYFLDEPGDVRQFEWQDAETLNYLWDEGVNTSLRTLDLGESDSPSTPDRDLAIPGISSASGKQKLALVGDTPDHPAELYLWNKADSAAQRLTDSNPWLSQIDLARQEVVEYQARDGLKLQGLLIRPLGEEPGRRYPLIIVVHGGPEAHFRNGWITDYSRLGQVAAARGYAVFYPNYRASTGRGVAFSKLDHGRPAMEEFDDLVDAIQHLAKNMELVDEKKVGVTGGSYGGYATAWCSTALSEHFAAGVMFVGISDKISKHGTSDIPEELYLVHDRKRLWEDWDLFLRQSPIYHVEKARTPLLIMHGKEDTRVHPSQSMELYRHLKTLGKVPVRLVFYPGEGHGNRKIAARYDYNLRTLRWFDHYLKGPGGEKPPAEIDYNAARSAAEPAKTD